MSDFFNSYKTTVLKDSKIKGESLEQTVDNLYLKAIGEIDVSAGRFIAGYLAANRLFLVFNHLVFDLEGVYCFFDEIAHIIKYQPVNCSSNPNELVRLIEKNSENFTDSQVESPWAEKEICNFMVEIEYPNPLESDMKESEQTLLLDHEMYLKAGKNLISPTNGRNKGMMYLLFGALLAANYRISGKTNIFGHFNHSYTGIPCFNAFTNIITWKVAGVPFILDFYKPGDEKDARSYLGNIKSYLDILLNEGYKIDILRRRNTNPELIKKLDSPIMLFNFRSDIVKMEEKAEECGLKLIESGYDYVPRLFPYAARHLFDLNFNNYEDGLFLSIGYSIKNYSEAFVDKFIRLFREELLSMTENCISPFFYSRIC